MMTIMRMRCAILTIAYCISKFSKKNLISYGHGKVSTNSILATKKAGPWRTLPSTALRVLVNSFVIFDEVGFKQDACSRDRIHGSDARNDHFSMLIMTMEE
jgi:hypothetical protein